MGDFLFLHASAGELRSLIAAFCVLFTLTSLSLVSMWLIFVDVREHKLPGAVVRPVWLGCAVLLTAAALLTQEFTRILFMGVGGVGMWVLYALLHRVSRGALGLGDVRLAGLLGTVLGFVSLWAVLWGVIFGFVSGGIIALGLLATRMVKTTDRIPFGPAMLLGAALALVLI